MYALLAVWGLRLGVPLGEEAPLRGSEAHDNTSLETAFGASLRLLPHLAHLAAAYRKWQYGNTHTRVDK